MVHSLLSFKRFSSSSFVGDFFFVGRSAVIIFYNQLFVWGLFEHSPYLLYKLTTKRPLNAQFVSLRNFFLFSPMLFSFKTSKFA